MQKFEKVKYTKSFELLFLVVSTVVVYVGIIFLLNRIINLGFFKFLLALTIAGIYFTFIKNRFIIKESDFKLTENQLQWNNKSIEFENIEYYKIHWTKGAGLKFKLKNGEVIRISSNENFCDSDKFVNLCHKVDSSLKKYHNQIIRKSSFFETKEGYYFAVIMTILFIIITIVKIFTKDKFNTGNIGLILVSLGIVWSGIKWKKQ